jgi:hypothetical protein
MSAYILARKKSPASVKVSHRPAIQAITMLFNVLSVCILGASLAGRVHGFPTNVTDVKDRVRNDRLSLYHRSVLRRVLSNVITVT